MSDQPEWTYPYGSQARYHLQHTHIFASDIEATIDFYRTWFDAEVAWDGDVAGARNVFMKIGIGALHLYDQLPRGDGRNAVHHLGMQVVGIDDVYDRMKAAGLHVPNPIRRLDGGGGYFMLGAPDGVVIEVFEPGPSRAATVRRVLRLRGLNGMAPPFITAATLFDVVAARAATSGATRALTFVDVDSGGRFHADHRTYDELRRSACALAGWLRKQGVRRGDTFAVMMANHPEFVEAMLATALTGAVMVPIDPRTMGDKLSYMLAFTACKGIICTADCAAAVAGLSPDGPRLDWALIVGGASASMPRIAPVCSDFAAARADTDCARVVDADDPMMLMFTSGTTGRPKAVVLSHGAYTGRARAMSAIAPEEGDILYTGLSLTHINAQGTLRLGLTAGLPVVFSRRFTRSQLWPICRAYRCTIFSILGGMIPEIYSLPESDEDIDNPVRLIISAGMPAALWTEFERRYGVKIYEIYGSTEGGGALVNPPGSGPIGSLGKPPPGLEAGVFDEAGRRCPPGRAGELRFRREDGAPTAITYYKDPAASDAKVVDGWFRTGDIAYADRDGWFFFCHRAGGGIRRDGDFINASIVEAALMKSKLLSDVFVYGVTTPRNVAGEKTLVAAVVARDPGLDLDGLREFCRAALQKRDVPEIFQVLDQIPKTISEKPIEAACIAMLRERGLV